MIINIWDYEPSANGVVGHGSRQKHAGKIASGCANYIVGLDIAPDALEAMKRANTVGQYVTAESLDPSRIREVYAEHIPPGKLADQVRMFSMYAASAGIERLRHIVFSHRADEPVDAAMNATHRKIIRRVMRTELCPSIGADHGDTGRDHGHEAVVTVEAHSGKPVQFGQGWWKEASQIALALCEYKSGLRPEPNRRYVADDSGVYHTFSDIRIADVEGNILLDPAGQPDRALVRSVQIAADELKNSNDAPDEEKPGGEWNLARAVQILAEPRIRKAQSWEEVHRNLARVGLRYVKVHTGAIIEAVQHGDDWAGRVLAASAAYPNAALGKLSRRLDCQYQPPPADLVVRPFVMPRYNKAGEGSADTGLQRDSKEQAEELEAHLRRDNRERQQKIYEAKLANETNEAIKRQAARARAELAAARRVARALRRKTLRGARAAAGEEGEPVDTLLWGGAPTGGAKRKPAEDDEETGRRYERRRTGEGIEYLRNGAVAFLETRNFIVLRARDRQAKIDALKRAEAKFGTIRILGPRKEAAELIELAAELGIKLGASQAEQGRKHLERIRSHSDASHLKRHQRDSDRRQRRQRGQRELGQLRPFLQSDKGKRRHRSHSWGKHQLSLWGHTNAVLDRRRKAPNPAPDPSYPAMRTLDLLNRDELLLPSSRYKVNSVRFLDDERLQQAFKGREHLLAREDVQLRLEAIKLVQQQQRHWICAAILSGRVTLGSSGLIASRPDERWAEAFYYRQQRDPRFEAMLCVARARPERYASFDFARPDLAVWRSLGGGQSKTSQLANLVADELHVATSSEEREALFRTMPYEEASKLRDAPGKFYSEYLRKYYPRPGAPNHRRRNASHSRRQGL